MITRHVERPLGRFLLSRCAVRVLESDSEHGRRFCRTCEDCRVVAQQDRIMTSRIALSLVACPTWHFVWKSSRYLVPCQQRSEVIKYQTKPMIVVLKTYRSRGSWHYTQLQHKGGFQFEFNLSVGPCESSTMRTDTTTSSVTQWGIRMTRPLFSPGRCHCRLKKVMACFRTKNVMPIRNSGK